MKSAKDNDSYQWVKFTEHWGGSMGMMGALFAFIVCKTFVAVLHFFLTLEGLAWIRVFDLSFAFMLAGVAFITWAKMPAYRSGQFFTFGLKSVPANLARHYRWGWRLFLFGFVLALALLIPKM